MKRIIIKGRGLVEGIAEGEALVTEEKVKFFLIDPKTGKMLKKGHVLEGKTISGKILIFPTGCGSTGDSTVLFEMAKSGTGPAGIINLKAEPILVVGAIMGGIPYVDRPDKNPMDCVETGDYVKLNGKNGLIRVLKS